MSPVFQNKADGKWYYGPTGCLRGPFNTPQEAEKAEEVERAEEVEIDNGPSL